MNILMAAAENDALPGGKVGGIADVVRDIPLALAAEGQRVNVVMPGYGSLSQHASAEHVTCISLNFAGRIEEVDVFKFPLENSHSNVTQWFIEHPLFALGGKGQIYCNDPDYRPFASDASKFALFSTAVAKAVVNGVFGQLDVLHIHDWHTATVAILRAYDPEYQALQAIKTVYTIHNLALQGIRPIDGDESSLCAWFPNLSFDYDKIGDPRYPHCVNPMRSGINLSDKVHAVSPTYAKEILCSSHAEFGYFGGEGLENDLRNAADVGKLHGILNGCEYPEKSQVGLARLDLLKLCETQVMKWLVDKPLVDSAHLIAITRLKQLIANTMLNTSSTPAMVFTSVGRITDQKVRLFQQVLDNGETALEQLLSIMPNDALFILLGSGDTKLEEYLTKVASTRSNFVFLKGYSQALSDQLYSSGDLFLMPSSFEPCGISQMLSMRAGQPCLAHSVGGLTDTIIHEVNGFTFNGDNPKKQAENMLNCFHYAIEVNDKNQQKWQVISKNAGQARFLWKDVALDYVKYLYAD
jgi:starch synthase